DSARQTRFPQAIRAGVQIQLSLSTRYDDPSNLTTIRTSTALVATRHGRIALVARREFLRLSAHRERSWRSGARLCSGSGEGRTSAGAARYLRSANESVPRQ